MRAVVIIFSLILLASCKKDNQGFGFSGSSMGKHESALHLDEELEMEAPRSGEAPAPPEYSLETGSKIIRNGFMEFEVSDLNDVKNEVEKITKSFNGHFENEQYHSHRNRMSYNLVLRIPNEKFDSTIVKLEQGLGKLVNKNISAKDVTEEYVDLNIRLKNKLAYLEQYKAILAKAKTIKEILNVQERIRAIEEEIESKKGRLKYLDNKTRYSTLNLEITEVLKGDYSNTPSFAKRIKRAFNNGISLFANFLVFLTSVWPFIIGIVLLYYGRKPLVNRIRKLGRKKV